MSRPGEIEFSTRMADAFSAATRNTTLGVAGLVTLGILHVGRIDLAGGYAAGVIGSWLLFRVNEHLIESLTGGGSKDGTPAEGNRRGRRGILLFLGKLIGISFYLTLSLHFCNLSPIAFAVGFSTLLGVMTMKAFLAVDLQGNLQDCTSRTTGAADSATASVLILPSRSEGPADRKAQRYRKD